MANFPKPYMQTTNENDPIMKRVNPDKTEIGARPSGLPADIRSSGMTIDHVGGSAGQKG